MAQDILLLELYDKFPSIIIRGGTAIWQCYGSNRFSEDIDVYLPLTLKAKNFKEFLESLKRKGFIIQKFKKTNNSIVAKFSYYDAIVRFEAVFKNVKNFVTKRFEMSDGTFIFVKTLKPEEIIKEKVLAYIKRRKVRDLYDIFFLLRFVEKKEEVGKVLNQLIKNFQKPIDEKELKALIIIGSIPSVEEMVEEVSKRVR